MKNQSKPRILFLAAADWYFWSHRLPLARQARDQGMEVFVVTRLDRHKQLLIDEGFFPIHIDFYRGLRNVIHELQTLRSIIRVYRTVRPSLVHHTSMKPILYGSIAAWWNDLPATINMITGLGFIFSSQSAWSKIVRWALMPVLKRLFRATNSYVIFQNKQDYDELCDADVVARARAAVIRGSGVDIERFFPRPEPDGQPVVLMASRMLWSKGVGDFVEAAKLLKNRRSLRCVLVGILDKENPDGVPEETLLEWDRQGIIEWWGERKDMDNVINNSHVVVLPTYYGEGLPKILLEAAACGRPLVATAVRGCLEIVRPEKNGFLVPPKDPPALAHAIEMLVGDPSLRALFGNQGREIVVQEFSSAKIVEETLAVYKNLLDRPSTVNSQPFLV